MAKALIVVAPQDRAHQITPRDISNVTTTRQTITIADPAATLRIGLSLTGASSTAKVLYVVLNATSDPDAVVKLALSGQRFVIPIGESRDFAFGPNSLLTRIDLQSDAASEAGSTLTTMEYGALI